MKTFEEWYKDEPMPNIGKGATVSEIFYLINREISNQAWNHQQKKIDKLIKCVEHYSDQSIYEGTYFGDDDYYTAIANSEEARQCLKELEGKE